MSLFTKTFQQILDSIDQYILRRNPTLDVKEGELVDDAFVGPPANELSEVYGQLQQLRLIQSLQNASSVDNDDADALVYNWGVTRKPGTQAVGTIVFYTSTTPSQDILIPQGTAVTTVPDSSGVSRRFLTTADVTFYGASNAAAYFSFITGLYEISVEVQDSEIGIAGNVASNTVVVNETGPTQFSVFNPQAFTGGTDQETNADLAARAIQVFSGIDINTAAGLIATALQNPNVTNAFAVGAGDPLMMRDINSLGKHVFGRADVYIRAGEVIGRQETFALQYLRVIGSNADVATIYVNGTSNTWNLYLGAQNLALGPTSGILTVTRVQKVSTGEIYNDFTINSEELVDLNRYDSTGRAIRYPKGTVIQINPLGNIGTSVPVRGDQWLVDYSYRAADDQVLGFAPVSEVLSVVGSIAGPLTQGVNWKFVPDSGINHSSVYADDAVRWLTLVIEATAEPVTRSASDIDTLAHPNVDSISAVYMIKTVTGEHASPNGSFTVTLVNPSTGLPDNSFLSSTDPATEVDSLRIVDAGENTLVDFDVSDAIIVSTDLETTITIDSVRNPGKTAPQVGDLIRVDYKWKRSFSSSAYQISADSTGIDWSPAATITNLISKSGTISPFISGPNGVALPTKTDEDTVTDSYDLTLLSSGREFAEKYVDGPVGTLASDIEAAGYLTFTSPDLVKTATYQIKIETKGIPGSIGLLDTNFESSPPNPWHDYQVQSGGLASKIHTTLNNDAILVQDTYHIRLTVQVGASGYVVFSDNQVGKIVVEKEFHVVGGIGDSFLLQDPVTHHPRNASRITQVSVLLTNPNRYENLSLVEDVDYSVSGYTADSGATWYGRVTMLTNAYSGQTLYWDYVVTTPAPNIVDLVNLGVLQRNFGVPNTDDIPGVQLLVDDPLGSIELNADARANVTALVTTQYSVSNVETDDVQFSLGAGITQNLQQVNITDVFVRDLQIVANEDHAAHTLGGFPLAPNLYANKTVITDKQHNLITGYTATTSVTGFVSFLTGDVQALIGGGLTNVIVPGYTLGTDYLVNQSVGLLVRVVSGSIPPGGGVSVQYDYSKYSEAITFSSAQQTQNLAVANIISNSIVVGKFDGITIFTEGLDYKVGVVSGMITRVATGSMLSNEKVRVAYNFYTKVYQEEVASGTPFTVPPGPIESGVPSVSDYYVDEVLGQVFLTGGTSIDWVHVQPLSVSYQYYTITYTEGVQYLLDRATNGVNANGGTNATISRLNTPITPIGPLSAARVTYAYNKSAILNVSSTPQADLISGYTFTPINLTEDLGDIGYILTYAFSPKFEVVAESTSKLLGVFEANAEPIINVIQGVNFQLNYDSSMSVGQTGKITTMKSLGEEPSAGDVYDVDYVFEAPSDGESVTVVYRFNKSVLEVQSALLKGKNITADVQAKSAEGTPVDIAVTVEVNSAANGEQVRVQLEQLLSTYLSTLNVATNVEMSDIDQQIRDQIPDVIDVTIPFNHLAVLGTINDASVTSGSTDFRLAHGVVADDTGLSIGSVGHSSVQFNDVGRAAFTTEASSPFDVLNVSTDGTIVGVTIANGDLDEIRKDDTLTLTIETPGYTNEIVNELHDANGQLNQTFDLVNAPNPTTSIVASVADASFSDFIISGKTITLIANPPLSSGTTISFSYQYSVATQTDKIVTDGTTNQTFSLSQTNIASVIQAVYSTNLFLTENIDFVINKITGTGTLYKSLPSGTAIFFMYTYNSTRGQYTIRGTDFDGGTLVNGTVPLNGIVTLASGVPSNFDDSVETAVNILAVTVDDSPIDSYILSYPLIGFRVANAVVTIDTKYAGRAYKIYYQKGHVICVGNLSTPDMSVALVLSNPDFRDFVKISQPNILLTLDSSEYSVSGTTITFDHGFDTTSTDLRIFFNRTSQVSLGQPTPNFYNSEYPNLAIPGAQLFVKNTTLANAGDSEKIHILRVAATSGKYFVHYLLGYVILGQSATINTAISYKWLSSSVAQDIPFAGNAYAVAGQIYARVRGSALGDFETSNFTTIFGA